MKRGTSLIQSVLMLFLMISQDREVCHKIVVVVVVLVISTVMSVVVLVVTVVILA